MGPPPAFGGFRALGTSIVVGATDPIRLAGVLETVRDEVEACDRACSRFRPDSELSRLNAGERLVRPSRWLCEAVATALQAARDTDGLVDPTIGQSLVDLGYDRTFDEIDPDTPLVVTASHVPAWRQVRVDCLRRRVSILAHVKLDLGATAKALCADRAARSAAAVSGCGVLVSLGGDIAVAGPAPVGGWVVRVTDRADRDPADPAPGQTVSVRSGGLATSGTSARRWARAGAVLHHLVDPRTGCSAKEIWRTVTVAAPSCVAANTASTAAVILGAHAPAWLDAGRFDARLVSPAGRVVRTGAWPADQGPGPVDHRPDEEAAAA
jgi:thiamine biosynthesis lipoprotein